MSKQRKTNHDYAREKKERIMLAIRTMLDFFIENADKLEPSEQVFDALDELQDFLDKVRRKPYEVNKR